MGLSFEFIGNACGVFKSGDGRRLLMDPWLVDGVFEGSWCHYPPLKTQTSDLQDVDAIYISHIHPDHFDERFFDYPRDVPIFILKQDLNFLKKRLTGLGYTHIIELEAGRPHQFADFTLTAFAPFATHNFHDAVVGNIIDSALVVQSSGVSAFNANDNTPTPEACRTLRKLFGSFDLAMINYNAAGPYPACFNNLSIDEKKSEHDRVLKRNMEYLVNLLKILKPRACLPFAGAYVLGGSLRELNTYLGTTTWDACAEFLRQNDVPCHVVTLRENDVLDLETLTPSKPYVAISLDDQQRYISDDLGKIVYPYEADLMPDEQQLLEDLERASRLMLERSDLIGLTTTFEVGVNFGKHQVRVLPSFSLNGVQGFRTLQCTLDARLLRRILSRLAQWNSAEIGCHITFFRQPNEYEPDLHTMLQFLHL